ncbi:MAG TPA: hypothetical protein VGE46_08710, partial [Bdellovibrio sp.]
MTHQGAALTFTDQEIKVFFVKSNAYLMPKSIQVSLFLGDLKMAKLILTNLLIMLFSTFSFANTLKVGLVLD